MELINGKEYYTVNEVADIIKISSATIYNYIRENEEMPQTILIDNIMHFSEDDVDKVEEVLLATVRKNSLKRRQYVKNSHNSYDRLKRVYAELQAEYAAALKEVEKLKKGGI